MALLLPFPWYGRSSWYNPPPASLKPSAPFLLCVLVLICLAELVIGSLDLALIDAPFLSVPLQDDRLFSNYQILLQRIIFIIRTQAPTSPITLIYANLRLWTPGLWEFL
jgi:hypothetical protein